MQFIFDVRGKKWFFQKDRVTCQFHGNITSFLTRTPTQIIFFWLKVTKNSKKPYDDN